MGQEYDITSKELIEITPEGWVTYLGAPRLPGQVKVISADLKTVSAEVDKVIWVEDAEPWLLHLEFQSRPEVGLGRRLLRYNAMLQSRHQLHVTSVAVLLRKEANSTDLSGSYTSTTPVGPSWNFGYHVVRLWQEPPQPFLNGSLGLAALAPLTNVGPPELPKLIGSIRERFNQEASLDLQGRLWTATKVLMGLKYEESITNLLLEGIQGMEDSVTYQAMVRSAREIAYQGGRQEGRQEGRQDEALRVLRRLGTRQFGPIPPEVETRLQALTNPDETDALIDRLFVITTWGELFQA